MLAAVSCTLTELFTYLCCSTYRLVTPLCTSRPLWVCERKSLHILKILVPVTAPAPWQDNKSTNQRDDEEINEQFTRIGLVLLSINGDNVKKRSIIFRSTGQKYSGLDQELALFSCKTPDSKYFQLCRTLHFSAVPICHCSTSVATDDTATNDCGCGSIKLY